MQEERAEAAWVSGPRTRRRSLPPPGCAAAASGGGSPAGAPRRYLGAAQQLRDEPDGLQVALGQQQLALLQPDLLLQLPLLLGLQLLQLLLAAPQLAVSLLLLTPAQLLLPLPLPLLLLQLLLLPVRDAGTRASAEPAGTPRERRRRSVSPPRPSPRTLRSAEAHGGGAGAIALRGRVWLSASPARTPWGGGTRHWKCSLEQGPPPLVGRTCAGHAACPTQPSRPVGWLQRTQTSFRGGGAPAPDVPTGDRAHRKALPARSQWHDPAAGCCRTGRPR